PDPLAAFGRDLYRALHLHLVCHRIPFIAVSATLRHLQAEGQAARGCRRHATQSRSAHQARGTSPSLPLLPDVITDVLTDRTPKLSRDGAVVVGGQPPESVTLLDGKPNADLLLSHAALAPGGRPQPSQQRREKLRGPKRSPS